MFQFPNLFPRFEDTRPVDVTVPAEEGAKPDGDAETDKAKDTKPDVKPDIKPTPAQLRGNAKKFGIKPPEGRIGSLVVMKSGRVKMVLGEGIVMDVSFTFVVCSRWKLTRLGFARSRNHLSATAGPPR
jgi:DNA-directed RNA polymerase III subunit RPC4